ncbi:hypothetical protein SDC9_165035 [bioreactor metagenome]|uniref:Uncharacterized protein n=1 Tax=bioreactor metagenome TaxID=1076179 RepID=A0A645FVF0_9ZZZZ
MAAAVAQTNTIQRTLRLFFPLAEMEALIDQRELHVGKCAHAREQVEVLEDETDLLVSDFRQFFFGILLNRLSIEDIFAAIRHIKTADDVHQGALSAAGRANNAYKFTFADGQVRAVQRAHFLSTDRIHLCDAGHGDDGFTACHDQLPPMVG